MADQKLLSSLSRLGFPMFEPVEQLDVNETLLHLHVNFSQIPLVVPVKQATRL